MHQLIHLLHKCGFIDGIEKFIPLYTGKYEAQIRVWGGQNHDFRPIRRVFQVIIKRKVLSRFDEGMKLFKRKAEQYTSVPYVYHFAIQALRYRYIAFFRNYCWFTHPLNLEVCNLCLFYLQAKFLFADKQDLISFV